MLLLGEGGGALTNEVSALMFLLLFENDVVQVLHN